MSGDSEPGERSFIAHAAVALEGVARLAAGDERWRGWFDVSADAFWRSFLALIPACVLFVYGRIAFSVMARNSDGQAEESAAAISLSYPQAAFFFIVLFLLTHPVFLVFSLYYAKLLNLKENFTPFVIVKNWTWLALSGVYALAATLGLLISASLGILLMLLVVALSAYVSARIALEALGASLGEATALAVIEFLWGPLSRQALIWLLTSWLLAPSAPGG